MLRRNFVAALASLFVIKKLPKVKDSGTFKGEVFHYHNQFKQWNRIKAAEPIDVGALVYSNGLGEAREYSNSTEDDIKILGVCMVNNWPEDVVVALYD